MNLAVVRAVKLLPALHARGDRQDLPSPQSRRFGLCYSEHKLRAALTIKQRAGMLMGPNCQRPKTAHTVPSLIEYDRTVRELRALRKVAPFLRVRARSQRVRSARNQSTEATHRGSLPRNPKCRLFLSIHCYLDSSSGAALCTRGLRNFPSKHSCRRQVHTRLDRRRSRRLSTVPRCEGSVTSDALFASSL